MEGNWAIVGASTAGLFTACCLAKEGFAVDLYEAEADWQPAHRTLIVTSEILRVLGEEPEGAVLNRITRFELISRGAEASITLREPDLVIDRSGLMQLLARKAREAGARLHFGHRLEEVEPNASGWILRFLGKKDPVRCIWLVGADGVHSVVARKTGGHPPRPLSLLQARVALHPRHPPDVVKVWFDRESTEFFYWLIPEGGGMAAVGLIAHDPVQARQALDRFLSSLGLEPIEYQAGTVASYHPKAHFRPQEGYGKAFLAGDAAGQVKVTTVGGVVAGLRGARAIAEFAAGGEIPSRTWKSLKRELDAHWLIRRFLSRFTDSDYDRLLRGLNDRGERLLALHNRDRIAPVLVTLALNQPGWVVLGARVLLRHLLRR